MQHDLRTFLIVIFCVVGAYGVALYSYLTSYPEEPETVAVLEAPQEEAVEPDPEDLVAIEEKPVDETLIITEGDTLAAILDRIGIPKVQSALVIDELSKVYDPRSLKVGQQIYVVYDKQKGGDDYDLQFMQISPDIQHNIEVSAVAGGQFKAEKKDKHLDHYYNHIQGDVNVSLYADALRQGASPKMVYDMISALSFDVDFQRDIKEGDKFSFIYDSYKDPETTLERPGELLYAELITGGRPHRVYRFQPQGGVPGYYTEKGESVRKALLKTPIDGARLSSRFGKRKHPVLGYNSMHKGVDFAAPTGTPVRSAGDGTVERANRFSTYGNYVMIRHDGSTKTAYAHLSKFAVKGGQKVRQGQVIGYVGATGRVTGPHLHFELLKNGKHVNPQSVTQLPGLKLAGKNLGRFNQIKSKADHLLKEVVVGQPYKMAEE